MPDRPDQSPVGDNVAPEARTVAARIRGAFVFALLNTVLSFAITSPLLLKSIREEGSGVLANVVMFFSSVSILNLACLALILLVVMVRAPRLLIAVVGVIFATILQLSLVADVKLYSDFRFHFNGMVVNFFLTEGAGDSFNLGLKTRLAMGATVVATILAEILLARTALYSCRPAFIRQRVWLLASVVLALILADKSVYAVAQLTDTTSIIAASRYCPLYIPVTINRVAAKWFGYKPRNDIGIKIREPSGTLKYPVKPLRFTASARKNNVVILIVDGLRHDMLAPATMPRFCEFAPQFINFRNHYSGGNCTRFGVFPLLYGLHGNLWHAFLNARQSPVLVDSLRDLGYELQIKSSTLLTFPEFRKTAFVAIPESIRDNYPQPTFDGRDTELVKDFSAFLSGRDTNRPFFACLFLNATHAMYQYPPEFEKFKPVADPDFNYAGAFTPERVTGLKNRYMNAISFLDSLSGQIVDDLRKHNLMNHTIVVITGDHGEEFMENGMFSHNSGFDDYVLKTVCLANIPGTPPHEVTNLTTHVDILPTIFENLGCENPPSDYSHGISLLAAKERDWVVAADWTSLAVVTPEHRLVIPNMIGSGQLLELRDGATYRKLDNRDIITRYRPALLEVVKDTSRFLR